MKDFLINIAKRYLYKHNFTIIPHSDRNQVLIGYQNYLKMKNKNEIISETLSQREFDIANLVVKGLKSKAIATQLGLSHHTVNNHITRIKLKLNCKSKPELVGYLLKNEIIKAGK